jgi:hypothetical protein
MTSKAVCVVEPELVGTVGVLLVSFGQLCVGIRKSYVISIQFRIVTIGIKTLIESFVIIPRIVIGNSSLNFKRP